MILKIATINQICGVPLQNTEGEEMEKTAIYNDMDDPVVIASPIAKKAEEHPFSEIRWEVKGRHGRALEGVYRNDDDTCSQELLEDTLRNLMYEN